MSSSRVFVFLESESFPNPIAIYAHNAAEAIYEPVAEILTTSDRIGDTSYLTAQIIKAVFDHFSFDGKNSFGVSAVSDPFEAALWADCASMVVNLDTGDWRIGDDSFTRFGELN